MTVTTWIIYVGKRQYTLTEAEFERLKNEIANNKTMVWYKDFVISIPHISSMERVYEHKDDMPQLAEITVDPAEASKRIADIKAQINKPMPKDLAAYEEEQRREELKKQASQI